MKKLTGWPAVAIALVLAILAATVPSGYYVIGPGGTYEIEPRLEVPAEQQKPMGRLAFTAVYAMPASWLDAGRAALSPIEEVVPVSEVRPAGISPQEFNEINRRLIEESKLVAAVVGMRAAGYDTRVTGQGAQVVDTLADMPASGVLQPGDVVIAVDGEPVGTATELVQAVQRREVGSQVRLTVVRDGQQMELVVGTASAPSEPGRPIVGASVVTRLFDVQLPFPVTFDTENVGGPSAGLMFSLGVLDRVTDGILTRGHFIAGTGTISVDGTVGPISGAPQKVVAARRDGAQIFLVPRQNYDEAAPMAESLRLVAVDNFQDALNALCGLEPRPGAEASVPVCGSD